MALNNETETKVHGRKVESPRAELERLQEQFWKDFDRGDLTKALSAALGVYSIESTSHKNISRKTLIDKILPALIENGEIQKSKWKSHHVWSWSTLGAIASVLCSGFALFKTFEVLKNANLATAGINLNAQVQAAQVQLQPWSMLQGIGGGAQQASSSLGQYYNGRLQGDKILLENEKSRLELMKERLREIDSTDSRKAAEAIEKINRIIEQSFQAKSAILRGPAG